MSDGCENKQCNENDLVNINSINQRCYKYYTVKHMKQPEAKSGSMEEEVRETALRTSVIKSITKYEFL